MGRGSKGVEERIAETAARSSGSFPELPTMAGSASGTTPFEPLPSAFSGPYIELRFIFLYNIPLNSQTAQ